MRVVEADDTAGCPFQVATWAVHRQDDNGNRFVVQTSLSREAAEQLVAELESRGHKQSYWVEAEQPKLDRLFGDDDA
jgi:hypothetical protein